MKLFKCQCCGGTVNSATYKCEYCGTQYEKLESDYIRIMSYNPGCQVLKSKMELRKEEIEMMGSQEAARFLSDRLLRNLADALAPYAKMETEFDPRTNREIVTASIRVINPDYRF